MSRQHPTTTRGYVNRNQQEVLYDTGEPGTDHGQALLHAPLPQRGARIQGERQRYPSAKVSDLPGRPAWRIDLERRGLGDRQSVAANMAT